VKIEFLNPFVTAAAEVLRAEAGVSIKRGNLSLESSGITMKDVATMISLVGDVEGMVIFSMPKAMCLALVSQMVGEEFSELNELAQSGVAELGNVIAGRAATKLSASGFATDISVPTLIIGNGATIATLRIQRLVVPLQTEFGTMEIHLALRERANGHG